VLSVSATQYVGWGWSSCDVCGGIVFLSDIQYFNVSIFDPSTNCFLAGYHQLPTAGLSSLMGATILCYHFPASTNVLERHLKILV